jgi:excisionase family DNA binding protein
MGFVCVKVRQQWQPQTQMEQVIFSQVPIADLQGYIAQTIQRELSVILKADPAPDPDELVTRKQAAQYLGLSLPTLHEYTMRGLVTAYRLGSRVRYRKGDLLNCLLKVQTVKHRAA